VKPSYQHNTTQHNSTQLNSAQQQYKQSIATATAIAMARTRSSRLFVVLLHLVGVSTDERWHNTNNNPLAIALEKVQLTHEGLEGLIRDYEEYGEDSALSQPFWLQVSRPRTRCTKFFAGCCKSRAIFGCQFIG
jgi:hypothetical protein